MPLWTAQLPGDDWVVGGLIAQRQADWLGLFGTFAALLSMLAVWTRYADELLRADRGLALLQFYSPGARLVRRALAWRVFVPVGVAIVGGGVISLILSMPADPADATDLPYGFALRVALVVVAVGSVAWTIAVRAHQSAGTRLLTDVPEE